MVGGIHTVLASRVPEVQQRHGEDGYIAIGPDVPRGESVAPEFRPDIWDRKLADSLQDHEVGVEMGRWLVPGEPRCLLINQSRLYQRKDEILGRYWERYGLDSLFGAWDYYDPVLFGHGAGMIIEHIRDRFLLPARQTAIVQAHEWMSASAILHLQTRRRKSEPCSRHTRPRSAAHLRHSEWIPTSTNRCQASSPRSRPRS